MASLVGGKSCDGVFMGDHLGVALQLVVATTVIRVPMCDNDVITTLKCANSPSEERAQDRELTVDNHCVSRILIHNDVGTERQPGLHHQQTITQPCDVQ